MKKFIPVVAIAAAFAVVSAKPALAIKPFGEAWGAYYVTDSANEDFKKLAGEAKCNVCHIQGENKKKHNPYGEALEKLLDKKDFGAERLKNEADKVKAELEAAFKKVESEKAKDGKTFKERMDAHMLPGGDKDGK